METCINSSYCYPYKIPVYGQGYHSWIEIPDEGMRKHNIYRWVLIPIVIPCFVQEHHNFQIFYNEYSVHPMLPDRLLLCGC